MSKKNILGIVGSPRKGGNTDILVDTILSGAEDAGANTEKVVLSDLLILPCKACDSCQKTGKCVLNDDMNDLSKKLDQYQIWVLGTPVYWWGPTAQMKAFVDRWYGFNYQGFSGKDIILAIPSGGGGRSYSQYVVDMFSDIIDYIGMNLIGTILAPGVGSRGAVRQHQSILNEAKQIGRSAILNPL